MAEGVGIRSEEFMYPFPTPARPHQPCIPPLRLPVEHHHLLLRDAYGKSLPVHTHTLLLLRKGLGEVGGGEGSFMNLKFGN